MPAKFLAGTNPWWFAKLVLSLLLLAWTVRSLLHHPTVFPILGQALLTAGGISNLFHYLLLKRHSGHLGAPVALRTTGGLFRWIRHPMYLSDIVLAAGLAWLCSDVVGFAIFIACTITIVGTARHEDRLMGETFGSEFEVWRLRTGLLLPRMLNSH